MNDTTTTSAEQAIKHELRRLAWMIPDAQRRLNDRLKDALDPNGILAPGKSGIWGSARGGRV